MPQLERVDVDKSCLSGKTIIWILGGPGSGKGTQCELAMVKHPDFEHISSGDLLRNEVMSGSKRGGQLYKLMSSGERVPNEIIDDLLAEAMVKRVEKGANGFLVDGYPLDMSQAEAFEKDICVPKLVISLEASDEVLAERLKTRNNFDDTDDSIAKRIAAYNAQTIPVVEKYGATVKRIQVERTKEEISADVLAAIATL